MAKRKYKYYASDFETTVYDNQEYTEVWASACVELNTEDVKIFHSIEEQFNFFVEQDSNIMAYFHNLNFDGEFWLPFLINKLQLKQAFISFNEEGTDGMFINTKEMKNNTFKYMISEMGQWYSITIKYKNRIIELRDSYKLLPFSLENIGKAFQTKHRKLKMEYEGFRYAGCDISDSEKEYIANDVLVLKEALEYMFKEDNTKLTIGACCLAEFKAQFDWRDYKRLFPNLSDVETPEGIGIKTVDDYVRKSYRGGWCYTVKGKESKIFHHGKTYDVNSLYPSQMHSVSGNRYPIGEPLFWTGNTIPDVAMREDRFYFIRIKTRFYLKDGYLPFIQIKGNPFYKGNENLVSSDIYDYKTDKYYTHYTNSEGELVDSSVILTLTQTDCQLFIEHYNVVDFEILDGCYFNTRIGLFDSYINKYAKIKMESKGAMRTQAKLFLNNLYGKMATNDISSFKVAYDDKGVIRYYTISEHNKRTGYIPIGSAITSYARNFTIRAAQKNFYGADKKGFIYADTDSIHCDIENVKGIDIDPVKFNHWKEESRWDEAIFVRQKTYIEHITHEDGIEIEKPYYNVKCAGMSKRPKELFVKSMTRDFDPKDYNDLELEFLEEHNTLEDFKVGLVVPGKLQPKRIRGGIVLVQGFYSMNPQKY